VPDFSTHLSLLPHKGIVVEPFSIREVAAKDPLHKHLGFNRMSFFAFFLLS